MAGDVRTEAIRLAGKTLGSCIALAVVLIMAEGYSAADAKTMVRGMISRALEEAFDGQ